MSETKKELRWFSIMDYEKEARYLSRMHQKGWKFKRVTSIHLKNASLRR